MIKIKVDPKTTQALKRMVESGVKLKEACDKALKAEWQRMTAERWADQQRALLNIEARQLAQWLKWYR